MIYGLVISAEIGTARHVTSWVGALLAADKFTQSVDI